MSKEFIFLICIVVFMAIQTLFLRGYFRYIKLSNDFSDRENKIKKVLQMPLFYSTIFNVDNFNNWFKNNKDNNIYANSGIYLRLDKLSKSHIDDYLLVITNKLISSKDFNELEIINFEDKVRENWAKQLMDKRK